MAKKWEKYSEEQLRIIVQESISVAEITMKLGYSKTGGGSYNTIYEMIDKYKFDTSHLLGQGFNSGKYDSSFLQNGIAVKSSVLKRLLIHIRGECCECCGLTTWNDNPIPLQIHHEDGNNLNNTLDNIHLICPNCHAITDNWRKPKQHNISDEEYLEALHNNKNIRQALLSMGLVPKGANYNRAKRLLNAQN